VLRLALCCFSFSVWLTTETVGTVKLLSWVVVSACVVVTAAQTGKLA